MVSLDIQDWFDDMDRWLNGKVGGLMFHWVDSTWVDWWIGRQMNWQMSNIGKKNGIQKGYIVWSTLKQGYVLELVPKTILLGIMLDYYLGWMFSG